MNEKVFQEMTDVAREHINADVEYLFSETEKSVLSRFFTNYHKKVFFVRFLPSAISSALLAMYSRIKNPRGLRGHFVDNLLPLILASFLPQFENGMNSDITGITEYIKENEISTLDAFIDHNSDTYALFAEFLENTNVNPEYFKKLAHSGKIQKFLSLFLDKYGHNSIARVGFEAFGIEGISTLAAKSLEWCRPASGFIELSTRFVSMDKAELYPIWREVAVVNGDIATDVKHGMLESFETYKRFMQTGGSSFADFLAKRYAKEVPDGKEMESAVLGETCDVMGNLLPAGTLTSLGIGISGEAMPELIRHLYLDKTPENCALAETIMEEAKKTGANQFLRHVEVSEWQKASWEYLSIGSFQNRVELWTPRNVLVYAPTNDMVERYMDPACVDYGGFREFVELLKKTPRGEFDKLPNQFEYLSAYAVGIMSFRSWRDSQRQTFATHLRTYLTPLLGFYQYDKPAPEWLNEEFTKMHERNKAMYRRMYDAGISSELMQYPLSLGNLIGFQVGANFRELEFVGWQRSKFGVNHEVRQVVLAVEQVLRDAYPWWKDLSRADMTPGYVFARSKKGIPLQEAIS